MRIAAEFIREQGGIAAARVFTHLWLALFGLWSWERVPVAADRDRAAAVVVPASTSTTSRAGRARRSWRSRSSKRTGRAGPLPFDLDELASRARRRAGGGSGRLAPHAAGCSRLDRVLRLYERRRSGRCAGSRSARAESWIVRRQEADGSWGGIQPPWVYSLIALDLCGYPLDHPVMRRGLEGIEIFMVEDRDDAHGVGAPKGRSRRLEACQSPVWDTALAMIALSDAGLLRRSSGDRAAGRWLLGEEVTVPRRLGGRSARGWRRAAGPSSSRTSTTPTSTTPPRSCSRWSGCGASRASTASRAPRGRARHVDGRDAEPGRRLGRVRRRQHARARARAAVPGLRRGDRRAERRRDRARRRDARRARARATSPPRAPACAGCSSTRSPTARGTGAGASTTSTAPARRCRPWSRPASRRDSSPIRRAVRWLERHQNDDGGWGEDARSYDDPHWIGRGPSTASQTAWALLALHAAGAGGEAMARGVAWLVATQRPDGTLGRAAVHRHRVPLRLLHQLPPLPAHVPGDGARAAAWRRSPAATPQRRTPRRACSDSLTESRG